MSYWDPFLAAVLCAPGWLSIPKLGLFGLDANRFPPTGSPFGFVALPLNADELVAGAVAFPGVETPPAVAVPQWTPAPPPGCPVSVPNGPAKTTPAEGSSRQAPMVSETNRCFFIAGFPSVETRTHQMHPCRAGASAFRCGLWAYENLKISRQRAAPGRRLSAAWRTLLWMNPYRLPRTA